MWSSCSHFAGVSGEVCGAVTTAAALPSCTTASNVNILSTTDTGISASCLSSVGGNLIIGGSNRLLATIQLPQLVSIEASFEIISTAPSFNTVLTLLDVHSLAYVGSSFVVTSNTALASIALPVLTSVVGPIILQGNSVLTAFSLPVLAAAGQYVSIFYNLALTAISAPGLTNIGQYVYIYQNSALFSIVLPALGSLGQYLSITGNSAMTSCSLPTLTYVGQYVYLAQNSAITVVSLPALTYVGQYFSVQQNSLLTTLSAPALIKIVGGGSTNNVAIYLCQNAASFSYSASIRAAAAGKTCYLNSCSTATTC